MSLSEAFSGWPERAVPLRFGEEIQALLLGGLDGAAEVREENLVETPSFETGSANREAVPLAAPSRGGKGGCGEPI